MHLDSLLSIQAHIFAHLHMQKQTHARHICRVKNVCKMGLHYHIVVDRKLEHFQPSLVPLFGGAFLCVS